MAYPRSAYLKGKSRNPAIDRTPRSMAVGGQVQMAASGQIRLAAAKSSTANTPEEMAWRRAARR